MQAGPSKPSIKSRRPVPRCANQADYAKRPQLLPVAVLTNPPIGWPHSTQAAELGGSSQARTLCSFKVGIALIDQRKGLVDIAGNVTR